MNENAITISADNDALIAAVAVLAAPEEAIEKQDLIRMVSIDKGSQGKFTLHTMAQRALFEFEDGELPIQWMPAGARLRARFSDQDLEVLCGVIVALSETNHVQVYAHNGVAVKQLLRAIHRYATRMIRLDVR